MTVRGTGRDSMAECQRDICGPSGTSGAALLLLQGHWWGPLTAPAVRADSLGEIPHQLVALLQAFRVLSEPE